VTIVVHTEEADLGAPTSMRVLLFFALVTVTNGWGLGNAADLAAKVKEAAQKVVGAATVDSSQDAAVVNGIPSDTTCPESGSPGCGCSSTNRAAGPKSEGYHTADMRRVGRGDRPGHTVPLSKLIPIPGGQFEMGTQPKANRKPHFISFLVGENIR